MVAFTPKKRFPGWTIMRMKLMKVQGKSMSKLVC